VYHVSLLIHENLAEACIVPYRYAQIDGVATLLTQIIEGSKQHALKYKLLAEPVTFVVGLSIACL